MSIHTRLLRSFGRQNESDSLQNFGAGRFGNEGDFAAAARARFEMAIGPDRATGDTDMRLPGGLNFIPSTLSLAQVAIVQFNSDDADDPHIAGTQNMQRDSISFVLLAPVGSGTVIYFTDRSWNGTVLGAAGGGDGTYTWTAGADMAAGTVITISEAELTAAGIELLDTGEVIYVYQGAINTPTTFLHAVEYGDGNDTFNGSLANTGLVAGVSALAIAEDNGSFGERTHNQQAAVLFQNINSHLNWHTNENSPQTNQVEGTNLHVAPDIQLWIAGISGGHGLISVSGDATQNGGLGYNVQTHFQNTSDDGNGLTTTNRFWSPTHILFDTVENRFFVVDSSGTNDRILQGNISDMLNNPGTAPPMTILWQRSAGRLRRRRHHRHAARYRQQPHLFHRQQPAAAGQLQHRQPDAGRARRPRHRRRQRQSTISPTRSRSTCRTAAPSSSRPRASATSSNCRRAAATSSSAR